MNKKELDYNTKVILGVIFFLILFGIYSSLFNQNKSSISSQIEGDTLKIEDNFPNIDEPHWTHMPIKYKLNNIGCSDIQTDHFLKGLREIENLTNGLVSFVESSEEFDLQVNCVDRVFLIEELSDCEEVVIYGNPQVIKWYDEGYINRSERRFTSATRINQTETMRIYNLCSIGLEEIGFNLDTEVLGEGRPLEISGNKILKGEVNLYQGFDNSSRCSFPAKEIHEVLHSFGFGHVEEPYFDPVYGYLTVEPLKDMMFPRIYCAYQKELNEKYVSCLKYIYSNGKIGFCSNEVNFMNLEKKCPSGSYPAGESGYCCPEPNMIIVDGYCGYS